MDGVANVGQAESGPTRCAARWEAQVTTDDQAEQARTRGSRRSVVNAGDRIRLVRQTDCDGDEQEDSRQSSVNADSSTGTRTATA